MSIEEKYNTPNSGCCGRPINYAKEPQCNYTDVCMDEYCCPKLGSIKETEPDCKAKAVIPSITVDTTDGITNLANCLVHVNDINTTFYIDDKHRILITWAGPVNIPGYDMEHNPNHYKNQIVTDTESEMAVIYDNHGNGFIFGITPGNLQEAINKKLDEMAEDGTLAELMNQYQRLIYIFPKHENETYSTWGDISLIKFNDRVICIDTGLNDRWNEIRSMLESQGIIHIDLLMISHWHNDHASNLENLINNNYVDSETTVYICGDVEGWPNIVEAQNYYKSLMDSEGISYRTPSEGEEINYNGLILQFNNTANLDEIYYQSPSSDYNSCSMVVGIRYKLHKSMFTGDASTATLNHLYDLGVASEKVDMYKVGHHAIGQATNQEFITNIHPNIGIVIASPSDSSNNMNAYAEECDIIERLGGIIYPTYIQPEYLIFESDGSNAVCLQGRPRNNASTIISKTVYVDANTSKSSLQDGTQAKPFKNIQQAIGSQPVYLDELTINVADGTYIPIEANSQKNIIKLSGKHFGNIKIKGNSDHPENVIVQSIVAENANVDIEGLTIKTDNSYYDGLLATKSNITLTKVNIGDSSLNHYSGITSRQSMLYIVDCNISYQRYGVILQRGSYAMISGCDFTHITEKYLTYNESHYNTMNVSYSNSTPSYFPHRKNENSPITLFEGFSDADFVSTIPLSTFATVKIHYRNNDYDAEVVEIPIANTARNYEIEQRFFSGDGAYIYDFLARIKVEPGTDTISLSRRHNITTKVSDNSITYDEPEHSYYFTKIEGIFAPIG